MPMATIVAGSQRSTSAGWPVPEEKRLVTVLFVDIVGSTALVDRLDPEDVRILQRAYFDTVGGVLRRWHGVVEKYVGDAVMALFGARRSDGFDAYRAVRAALEIQGALDRRPPPGAPHLRVRAGVATGEALVDLAAARDGGHGVASGAVITTAARLQEYAPPGGVALCAATHRATVGLVDQRRVPPVALAGKALPVDVWHATGTIRPAPARHEGPLVGRRRELAAARDLIVRAVRGRDPRWLSLVGPAGSGRSRLLHELTRAVRTVDGVPVRWCVAHCPPYPEPLAPVADLVRGLAGLRAGEPPATVRRRLTAALTDLVPPAGLSEAVYALEALLGTPDGSGDAARGAEVAREALLGLAARQPVMVAVDDLDRGTAPLHRFLRRLFAAATARSLPLVVVTLHRPEGTGVLPCPRDRQHRLAVPPLRPVETGRLLRHLLGRADRPTAAIVRLLPLVGGNPGRAVAYVASPDAARSVPEAVRREVDARLDRLDGARRAALMAVATVGAGITAATVARLLDWAPGRAAPVLRALAATGLLVTRPDGRYAVADAVVREVAYARLPRAARAAFARRAGRPAESDAPSVPVVVHAPTADVRPARVDADRPAARNARGSHPAPLRRPAAAPRFSATPRPATTPQVVTSPQVATLPRVADVPRVAVVPGARPVPGPLVAVPSERVGDGRVVELRGWTAARGRVPSADPDPTAALDRSTGQGPTSALGAGGSARRQGRGQRPRWVLPRGTPIAA
ncbi:adenylate/guanylate cyclase domain-containing protein [Micromonospora sp. DSM 115977]|uniref:Adenylate/guanylate cyclase domain-containing protein n=1 Tax=Micromonospora reichwaldensis TaxID=3075516 RepID=A0ABU2WXK2_9ACTN|nr:adenylate/guanylate cyclase domain-containing protein [Micromonospora sp. DSM 115977]MDT0530668.1 adenylate/guanylate cyclase domain-containing protein [Micromonospora sp. DSM 115977]